MSKIVKYSMGNWKAHKMQKGQRASRTYSRKCRIYWAYPPVTGWPGGANCVANGMRTRGGK